MRRTLTVGGTIFSLLALLVVRRPGRPARPANRAPVAVPERAQPAGRGSRGYNLVTIGAMLALLAFGGLGLGYAAWTDSLTIDATAGTGTFDVSWGAVSAVDDEPANANVGICTIAVSGDVLDVDVTNIYPGYTCTLDIVISAAASTIPARIAMPVLNASSGDMPDAVTLSTDPDCEIGDVIPAGGSVSCTYVVAMSASATGGEGASLRFNQALNVTQAVN